MADLEFSNHGSVATCAVLTDAGREWVEEHIPLEGWQWMGNDTFAVEPRYVPDLIEAAACDGLEVW